MADGGAFNGGGSGGGAGGAGKVILTNATPAPVPEAVTTLSFGLLLALGSLVVAKRKKAKD